MLFQAILVLADVLAVFGGVMPPKHDTGIMPDIGPSAPDTGAGIGGPTGQGLGGPGDFSVNVDPSSIDFPSQVDPPVGGDIPFVGSVDTNIRTRIADTIRQIDSGSDGSSDIALDINPTGPKARTPIVLRENEEIVDNFVCSTCDSASLCQRSHSTECYKYISCIKPPDWTEDYTAIARLCPFGTFFNESKQVCVAPGDANCKYDQCRNINIRSYQHPDGTCGSYWKCEGSPAGRISKAACCGQGQSFNPNTGMCQSDSSCTDPCPDPRTASCNGVSKPIPGSPNCRTYWKCQDGLHVGSCCPFGYRYVYSADQQQCVHDPLCKSDCPDGFDMTKAGVKEKMDEDEIVDVVEVETEDTYKQDPGTVNLIADTLSHSQAQVITCSGGHILADTDVDVTSIDIGSTVDVVDVSTIEMSASGDTCHTIVMNAGGDGNTTGVQKSAVNSAVTATEGCDTIDEENAEVNYSTVVSAIDENGDAIGLTYVYSRDDDSSTIDVVNDRGILTSTNESIVGEVIAVDASFIADTSDIHMDTTCAGDISTVYTTCIEANTVDTTCIGVGTIDTTCVDAGTKDTTYEAVGTKDTTYVDVITKDTTYVDAGTTSIHFGTIDTCVGTVSTIDTTYTDVTNLDITCIDAIDTTDVGDYGTVTTTYLDGSNIATTCVQDSMTPSSANVESVPVSVPVTGECYSIESITDRNSGTMDASIPGSPGTITTNISRNVDTILTASDWSASSCDLKMGAAENSDVSTKKQDVQDEAKEQLSEHDEQMTPESTQSTVDDGLVQIRASKSEIERRIAAFIQQKRTEIDEANRREFCGVLSQEVVEDTCARTDAIFVPRAGGKSHIKVSRVINTYGPQTRRLAGSGQSPSRPRIKQEPGLTDGIEERLANMEEHLRLKGTPRGEVFSRLKALEERILYLESLSPEYFNYVPPPPKRRKFSGSVKQSESFQQEMSITEIDTHIKALKESLLRKKPG